LVGGSGGDGMYGYNKFDKYAVEKPTMNIRRKNGY